MSLSRVQPTKSSKRGTVPWPRPFHHSRNSITSPTITDSSKSPRMMPLSRSVPRVISIDMRKFSDGSSRRGLPSASLQFPQPMNGQNENGCSRSQRL